MQTSQFVLRPWRIEDVDQLVLVANNWNIAKFLTDQFPHPYTVQNGQDFINFAIHTTTSHIFAIDIDGKAVGGIGIHPQQDIFRLNAELGYWLAEPFWSKGIISEAVHVMVDFAFQHLDIHRIFARPFDTNVASQKVLLKNGFVLEGRFEKTIIKDHILLDELIYAIRKDQWFVQK